MINKVIDISKYQPDVKYDLLKNDGIDGAIIRAVSTNNSGLYIDPCFETHYQGCVNAGLSVGAYLFSYATTASEIETEINLFLKVIKGKKFDLPIVLDYETKYQSMTKQARTNVIKYGLTLLENAGYFATWYTYKDFFKNYVLPEQLTNYDFWLAWYTSFKPQPAIYNNYGIWQYTSTGQIAAISGNVDLNNVYRDYPTIIKNAGLNGYAKDVPEIKPDTAKLKTALEKLQTDLTIIIDNIDDYFN